MEAAKSKSEATRAPVQAPFLTNSDIQPLEDVSQYLRAYARQKPVMAALWIFGIGFVLGWKLKPW